MYDEQTTRANPTPSGPQLSEAELWRRCQAIWREAGADNQTADELMLLIWNIAYQPDIYAAQDLAESLIHKLYCLTTHSEASCRDYLQARPSQNHGRAATQLRAV